MTDIVKPTYISFTGADDKTDIEALINLDERWENRIEFGLLYFPEKQGQVRNPSPAWLEQLYLKAPWIQTTAHLCGKQVFQEILDNPEMFDIEQDVKHPLLHFERMQLNINARNADFTPTQVWQIYDTLHAGGVEMILQYNEQSAPTIDEWFRVGQGLKRGEFNHDFFSKVQVLYDTSRGRGIHPDTWPVADLPGHLVCQRRYAGGITLDNVVDTVVKVNQARAQERRPPSFARFASFDWGLDLESGARVNNEFDVATVDEIMVYIYGEPFKGAA